MSKIGFSEPVAGPRNEANPPLIRVSGSLGGGGGGQRVDGAAYTLVSSGALLADNTYSAVSGALDNSTDLDTRCDFVLAMTPAAIMTGGTIDLYRQHLNIDGVNDGPTPSATYSHHFVGSFRHTGAASAQTLIIYGAELVPESAYVLRNNATGADISAGWRLLAQAWSK